MELKTFFSGVDGVGRGVAQRPVVWQGGGVGVWGFGCGYSGGVG